MERCNWSGTEQIYIDYHDIEWGEPIKEDYDYGIEFASGQNLLYCYLN